MRIAILGCRGIPARYGGFETFAERLSAGLAARGHDVTVFCEAQECPVSTQFGQVRLRYVSAPRLGPLHTILYDLFSLWTARSSYDVVYMLGYGAAAFCWLPQISGTEVWINPDGLEWARAKWGLAARIYFRAMEWASLRVADRVIADAQSIADNLAQRHSRLHHCSVIPYGCEIPSTPPDSKLVQEWSLTPGSYYIVICRLEPENHVREIIEGFCSSKSTRQLVIVGNHLAKTAYVRGLREINNPNVRVIGTIYDQEKLNALRTYAFGYFHGHSVGGTNPSLLEAMACGNLIFAHDNPFNRETMDSCGLFFGSADHLSELIREAESDGFDADTLRALAQSRAKERYSWSRIIESYARLLEHQA
jgi:glycosyltransferase involved in cell wall biosynthesis